MEKIEIWREGFFVSANWFHTKALFVGYVRLGAVPADYRVDFQLTDSNVHN